MVANIEKLVKMSKNIKEDDNIDWDSGDEEDNIVIPSKCLFCVAEFEHPEECFSHCSKMHEFVISAAKSKLSLDCFSYIKMVNYCRKNNPTADELTQMSPSMWNSEAYLIPVVQDDGLLQFDIEDDFEAHVSSDPDSADFDTVKELTRRCTVAETRASQAEEALSSALSDLAKMREVANSFMIGDAGGVALVESHESIQNLKEGDDDAYFDSYGHFGIHQEMLADSARTKFYHDCIHASRDLFKDKIVLDVGCGTGILSMFAAKAGAKMVIAVEMSDIYYQAVDIIRENELEDIVHLLKGRMEDVTLPVEKVDIIISEWMGYFLLFESMLDTVLWARDRYLAVDGYILPNLCNINIVGLQDKAIHDKNVGFWDNVYGFSMSCMKTAVVKEAIVTSVNAKNVCTDISTLNNFDLLKCSTKDLEFKSSFQLKSTLDTEITALAGYFDIFWDTRSFNSTCSTSPSVNPTHWKQTVFLLETPVAVHAGDIVDGKLSCSKNSKDPRSLSITITLKGNVLKYCMQ